MFPRKKRNRTGTISVVVVDKSRGGFKEIKNFGVAKTEEEEEEEAEADHLFTKASEWVRRFGGQQEIDFVIVADSGLLNKTNIELLRQAGYKFSELYFFIEKLWEYYRTIK